MRLNTVSVEVLKKRRICTGCVEDDFLQKKGAKGRCSYCKAPRAATMAIDDFADYVELAFDQHYELTTEDPYPFEGRSGNPVDYLMQEAAGTKLFRANPNSSTPACYVLSPPALSPF